MISPDNAPSRSKLPEVLEAIRETEGPNGASSILIRKYLDQKNWNDAKKLLQIALREDLVVMPRRGLYMLPNLGEELATNMGRPTGPDDRCGRKPKCPKKKTCRSRRKSKCPKKRRPNPCCPKKKRRPNPCCPKKKRRVNMCCPKKRKPRPCCKSRCDVPRVSFHHHPTEQGAQLSSNQPNSQEMNHPMDEQN
jgi:hypothetical protein